MLAVLTGVMALMGFACASAPATCSDVRLTPEAERGLEAAAAQVDFGPALPCAFGEGFMVTSVIVDRLPGVQPRARISFIVDFTAGGRAYVLSQTRVAVTSAQIAQSTHRVRVTSEAGVVAEGFSGPTGSGGDATYLRWRSDDITYELDATLGRRLTDADVQRIAAALMLRGAAPRSSSATPSGP